MKNSLSKTEFAKVLNKSHSFKFNQIKFKYRKNFRHAIGFNVSRKYGTAVNRNLFKRRCRSAYQLYMIDSLYDCSMIITPLTSNLMWENIINAFENISRQINNGS